MLTVRSERLGFVAGDRVLDLGCGAGRHAFEAMRNGAAVVAIDADAAEVKDTAALMTALAETDERTRASRGSGSAMAGDAVCLPFADDSFDRIIAAEVLEHVPADRLVLAELSRVLRPGGTIAVTVPRWFPELVCWALSDDYHLVPGGHVRIYRRPDSRLAAGGRRFRGLRLPLRPRPAQPVLVAQVRGRGRRRPPPARAGLPPGARLGHHRRHPVHPGPRPPSQSRSRQVAGALRPQTGDVSLTSAQMAATADWIASVQLGNGMIPWFPGGHADPWNHVEAAMALVAAGRSAEAERAFEWLRATQHADGSWCVYYLAEGIEEPRRDTNVCAYVATGTWWHYLVTGDAGLLSEMWPVIERAVGFVLRLQQPGGEVLWSLEPDGTPGRFALLTGSSSIHHSLRCALAVARALGFERPEWELAAGRVAHAVAHDEDAFEPKDRWAMDWYYPVLCGAVAGGAGRARLLERWDVFVMDGLGVRCVSDRPWVTAAETAECAMAMDSVGLARGGPAAAGLDGPPARRRRRLLDRVRAPAVRAFSRRRAFDLHGGRGPAGRRRSPRPADRRPACSGGRHCRRCSTCRAPRSAWRGIGRHRAARTGAGHRLPGDRPAVAAMTRSAARRPDAMQAGMPEPR